jgi:hypothetical protein
MDKDKDLPAHLKGMSNLTSVEVNEAFLLRTDKFWNLLAKNIHIAGPATLPFYTNFSIGSGKARYSFGRKISDKPWFNLREQSFQLSIPTVNGKLTHNFENSFHGGSSLLLEKQNLMRIFTCNFECKAPFIFACAFKRLAKNVDLKFYLKVLNEITNESFVVALGDLNQTETEFLQVTDVQYEDVLKLSNQETTKINLFDPRKISKNWNVR